MSSSTRTNNSRFSLDIERPMLTPVQLAKILNTSVDDIYWLKASGKLKGIRIGKYVRFDPRDVEDFLARQNPGLVCR